MTPNLVPWLNRNLWEDCELGERARRRDQGRSDVVVLKLRRVSLRNCHRRIPEYRRCLALSRKLCASP